jgi:hypothetical protein
MLLTHTDLHRVPERCPRNQAYADTSSTSLACVSKLIIYSFTLEISLIWRIEVVFNNVVGATITPASGSLFIYLCITIYPHPVGTILGTTQTFTPPKQLRNAHPGEPPTEHAPGTV